MHAMFGLTGGVLLSAEEFPSLPIAAVRAQEALHTVQPVWLETDHGKVTPGQIREQLEPNVGAVAVSLVDSRTGYLCDIEGIRQVIGDRLLIVDAIQGFGVVDAPWEVADVVVAGGQKWCRAGWGTGFMALSERARSSSSRPCSRASPEPRRPSRGGTCRRRRPTRAPTGCPTPTPSPRRASRRASRRSPTSASPAINAAVAERVSRVIELADEYALAVVSSRDEQERAGIVVLEPPAEQVTAAHRLAAQPRRHRDARGSGRCASRSTPRPPTRRSRCCAPRSCRTRSAASY